ncbi:SDR family NAD(P)-dependent oxidoreductase [Kaistella palustris]|uniref:SDR family NAD(P)-dependent oxidoreductase n=1 Tax=Kaistella palustris TaxID=493376 RepID=UPI000417686C|nr:SDR family NAD(P)-dependent oxidoreductase [Kaistella palustris]
MKTALITGATSGIGKATADRFAKEGYRLILCGRRTEILAELQKTVSALTEVYTLNFDQRYFEEVKTALNSLPANWQNVDIVINNAGNAHGLETLEDGNVADWDAMLDGNVKGILYVTKLLIPKMKENKSGHIVNISSVAARQTYANGVVYCASKRAVDVLSEGMRLELTEYGIKVTNLQPGLVETDFSKVRFKGDEQRAETVYQGYEALKPEDIADAIFYCVSAPKHVAISDLTIYPSAQSESRTVYKNL